MRSIIAPEGMFACVFVYDLNMLALKLYLILLMEVLKSTGCMQMFQVALNRYKKNTSIKHVRAVSYVFNLCVFP